ncbi:hypothetical protein F5B18DRAFT_417 [Nemania serpens]|nr:hypothetical protein F5B18DRAFT_417 [Nemania serpens]
MYLFGYILSKSLSCRSPEYGTLGYMAFSVLSPGYGGAKEGPKKYRRANYRSWAPNETKVRWSDVVYAQHCLTFPFIHVNISIYYLIMFAYLIAANSARSSSTNLYWLTGLSKQANFILSNFVSLFSNMFHISQSAPSYNPTLKYPVDYLNTRSGSWTNPPCRHRPPIPSLQL